MAHHCLLWHYDTHTDLYVSVLLALIGNRYHFPVLQSNYNPSKTKEMVFDFSKSHHVTSSIFIDENEIESVLDFKYLGTFFSKDL